jgi:peptidoglycan/xylan/chitin deacetylase (PgdA/CDA1 family)
MKRQRRSPGRILVVALVVLATTVLGPPAHAAPPDPGPPPDPLVEGPWPPSRVLAVDPATIDPPVSAARAANTCPAAPYGIQRSAPGAGRTVALTFDDGPGASTDAILQILREQNVRATFFNVGVNESVRPATVRAMRDQGHLLANHTWSHPDMTRLTSAQQAAEMDNESNQQASITGSFPCFFRPPYGATNSTTLSLAQARRMAVFNWSVDTEDWKANGSADQSWVNRIISLAQAGGSQTHPVVLLHNQANAMPATVAALPAIIAFYRDRGYTFVDLMGRSASTDRMITGDWDGNGTMTPGIVRGNTWYLRNSNTPGPADMVFAYGLPTDRVITGDWDGNGSFTPGIVRGDRWHLRNTNSTGTAHIAFSYGVPTDRMITGDWDGNGSFTPGIVRGDRWHLRNTNSTGTAHIAFTYGVPTDRVITGDWDGNGSSTPGIIRDGSRWHLRNTNSTGPAHIALTYGGGTDVPVAGDWDASGSWTPGIVRDGSRWHLRNVNSTGTAHIAFTFSP